jgi:sialic acid synthase SpsE
MTKIIADFCCNHLNDRLLIEEGIKRLAEIKVDYIKFQTFTADKLNKMYPDYDKMHKYYKDMELSIETHMFIVDKCEKYGIKPLFTAFGVDEALMLRNIGMFKVKIASPDADNIELLNYCKAHFEESIISCGMISDAKYNMLRRKYTYAKFLYCVSKYPTDYDDIDFDKMIFYDGFSDHTADIRASIKAIGLGVEYVERHFTLGKDLPGKDHKISSTVDEFAKLVAERDYVASIPKYKSRWRNF